MALRVISETLTGSLAVGPSCDPPVPWWPFPFPAWLRWCWSPEIPNTTSPPTTIAAPTIAITPA